MSRSPAELVTQFCALWSTPDATAIAEDMAEDAVYHNIPMEPARGREAIRAFVQAFG
jgi:limonene-1,2-epoxide hydrolase